MNYDGILNKKTWQKEGLNYQPFAYRMYNL